MHHCHFTDVSPFFILLPCLALRCFPWSLCLCCPSSVTSCGCMSVHFYMSWHFFSAFYHMQIGRQHKLLCQALLLKAVWLLGWICSVHLTKSDLQMYLELLNCSRSLKVIANTSGAPLGAGTTSGAASLIRLPNSNGFAQQVIYLLDKNIYIRLR